jgi:hypothetical protein
VVTQGLEYSPLRGLELQPGTIIAFSRPIDLWMDPEFPIHLASEGIPQPPAAIVVEYTREDGYISLSWGGRAVLLEGWDVVKIKVVWSPVKVQQDRL